MALSQPAPASAAGAPAVRNPQSSRPNWLYPTVVVVVFSAFIVYGVVVGLFETSGRYGPYLSPFFSPEIYVRIGGFLIPPGIWIAPFPLAFRLTCYYYRTAYFRSFLWTPPACAVRDARARYTGEARFPLLLQKAPRYFFYLV